MYLQKFTMLLCLFPVSDMMDMDKGAEAVTCIGLFESRDAADYVRLGIAGVVPHGTRLVTVTTDTKRSEVVTDVLVVVKDIAN